MGATIPLTVLAIALSACGVNEGIASTNPSTTTSTTTSEGNEGGFGAPSQAPGEFVVSPGKPVVGTLRLADNGCWYADVNDTERLIVLPAGFELKTEIGGELIDEQGVIYRDGDRFDAVGSMIHGGSIPGGQDGRWGNYMAFCQPQLDELAVFSSFVKEFDPTALSSPEMIELIENAVFTEHFPCGRGWATSTADQRVGLVIYEAAPDVAVRSDRIVLPDPDWNASVLIGKNLFSEHCNDAIEGWIALPTIATQWPLAAGTVTIADSIPGYEEDPARVRAVLEGGQVDTGSGSITLPRVELDNSDFNFFAG